MKPLYLKVCLYKPHCLMDLCLLFLKGKVVEKVSLCRPLAHGSSEPPVYDSMVFDHQLTL